MSAEPLAVLLDVLCCPCPDHGDLRQDRDTLVCSACGRSFPVMSGRPILIDEAHSLFSIAEIMRQSDKRQFPTVRGGKAGLRNLFPAGANRPEKTKAAAVLAKHHALVPEASTICVIGCGFTKNVYSQLFPTALVILTDITLQGSSNVACDGTCLPFRDRTVDVFIIEEVLEHVIDPHAVVQEMDRCLRPGGLVFSSIPFAQPLHGIPFDFQRFTPLGHRLLFRDFERLEFFVVPGPATALCRNAIGFFASVTRNVWFNRVASMVLRILFRPLFWIDASTSSRQTMLPSGSVFFGQKIGNPQSLKAVREEIVNWYGKPPVK